jgi:voltage-gated potassium channel
MTKQSKEERWQQRTEWPLALVAVVFLVMYSVQVLNRPHGEEARILWLATWIAWSLFVLDYIVRLYLAKLTVDSGSSDTYSTC